MWKWQFMMANHDIVEFIATMQRFDWQVCKFLIKASVHMPLANKEFIRKCKLHFCFLFLNWKVLSSETFTAFFSCRKPRAEEISWISSHACKCVILPLKPMYNFGKWWKLKFSLMGFVYRVVRVLKALCIFLSETINFLRKLHKTNIFGMPPKILP